MEGTAASAMKQRVVIDVGSLNSVPLDRKKNVPKPTPIHFDDPASATIEALKNQSVVFLNSSVQIFKTDKGNAAGADKKRSFPTAVIKPEKHCQDDRLEGAIPYDVFSCSSDDYDDDSISNGWDDFGFDEPGDRTIDYICRKCGNTFQSSSDGEFYFCPDCKPASGDENGFQSHLIPPVTPQLHYAKYSCKSCGVDFYSKIGNYNFCEVCSGLHATIIPQRKNFLNSFVPTTSDKTSQGGTFSWGYIKKECHICGHDFYNRLENWYYCPKCVIDSSSNKSKKKPKKHQNNKVDNTDSIKSDSATVQDSQSADNLQCDNSKESNAAISIEKEPENKTNAFKKPEEAVIDSENKEKEKEEKSDVSSETINKAAVNDDKNEERNEPQKPNDDDISKITIKVEPQEASSKENENENTVKQDLDEPSKTVVKIEPLDHIKIEEMIRDTIVKSEAEIKESMANGETKENHSTEEEKCVNNPFHSATFTFIVYACKLCKKSYYSNLVDCFYCQVCCNAHSIINRAKRFENKSEEYRKLKELTRQESIKAEKYDKYECKVCFKEFYSSVGEWDFCNNCNADNNCGGKMKNKVVSSFTRKNVTFNRYSCNICKNFFFSSREDQDCCKKCTKIISSMKIHQNLDDSENNWEDVVYAKYICKVCEKSFYSKVGEYYYCSECNPETKLMIKNKKMFACAHCDFETHLKKELRRHLLTIPKDRKRKCFCAQCYNTAEPLAEGEVQEAIIFKCKDCEYTSKHKKRLRMHRNMVHKGKVPLYACKHCNFKSCHKGRLKCHIMTKHEGLKVYQCEQCDYATRQTGRLMMHIAVVHQGEKPYLCAVCHERFATKAALKSHASFKHEANNREPAPPKLKCEKCKFTTTQKKTMDSHMANHEDEFLVCAECNFSTSAVPKLVQHIVTTHAKKNSFSCTMCNVKTTQKRRLESHIISRHAGNNRFKCEKCSFSAPDRAKLKKHVTFSHSRPKTYRKNHIVQHCPYCDYTVKQIKRFTDHVAAAHPNEPPFNPVWPKKRARKRRYNRKAPRTSSVEETNTPDDANDAADESLVDGDEDDALDQSAEETLDNTEDNNETKNDETIENTSSEYSEIKENEISINNDVSMNAAQEVGSSQNKEPSKNDSLANNEKLENNSPVVNEPSTIKSSNNDENTENASLANDEIPENTSPDDNDETTTNTSPEHTPRKRRRVR